MLTRDARFAIVDRDGDVIGMLWRRQQEPAAQHGRDDVVAFGPYETELIAHRGMFYIDKIALTANAGKTYLEVGTHNGASLAPIRCASVAIDPSFKITENIMGEKSVCHLYQETSDDYFSAHDPKADLGSTIDTAFLDGMHLFEYLLRDFINVEKHCGPESTIFLHDCLPPTFEMTNRAGKMAERTYKGYWTGDVWKVVPILQKYRPELTLTFYDCPPTGLVAVTGLVPASPVLAERYNEAVAQWAENSGDFDNLRSFFGSVKITRTLV